MYIREPATAFTRRPRVRVFGALDAVIVWTAVSSRLNAPRRERAHRPRLRALPPLAVGALIKRRIALGLCKGRRW